jgi:Adenylate and Guanylate cyclase catalytic domain
VRCGAEVQRELAERNVLTPPEKRIEFRVGINLGDVIAEADDIFGDGVNIAARLEALAEPGGILVSNTNTVMSTSATDCPWCCVQPRSGRTFRRPTTELSRRLGRLIKFLPRRSFENYMLHPGAAFAPQGHPPPKVRFAGDSPLEGDGFEPSASHQKDVCNTEIVADGEQRGADRRKNDENADPAPLHDQRR